MTSDKQVRANQQNALKSTGPKTPEGKAAIRHNALTHGLLSQEVLLPGEDEAALKELGESLRAELQPVGELENMLVEQIIAASWRLRRLRRVETGIFTAELYGELTKRAQQEARTYERTEIDDLLESTDKTTIIDERRHKEAISKVEEMKGIRDSETGMLGQAFVRDADKANAFSKLSRYETPIERSLYKALHELQRLQAARHAEGNVPPPAALDVDVSGVSREDL
jgi:hypothetical protein